MAVMNLLYCIHIIILSTNIKVSNMNKYLSSTWTKFVLILKLLFVKIGLSKMNEDRSDVRSKAYKWCKGSLGGPWSRVSKEDLRIQTISGGLTNKLYLCSLPNDVDTDDNVPRKVLMRVYGEIAKQNDFLVRNSVIFALFSEKKKGPKLYGMYAEGRIEEFIPTKSLRRAELFDKSISMQIAHKLAYFHTLEMPLIKQPKFLRDQMNSWLIDADRILNKLSKSKNVNPCVTKLQSFNLSEELKRLLSLIVACPSPVVFSHNDLQEGNILYMENESNDDKKLTVIDWEYGSYNYRGFDFGNHFCEWSCDYSVTEFPYYSYHPNDYPSQERQHTFFKQYLEEQNSVLNKSCEITDEELDSMYREANVFAMASHFMWGLWSIVQLEISDIEFGYLEYAVTRFEGYFEKKEMNYKEGLIKESD